MKVAAHSRGRSLIFSPRFAAPVPDADATRTARLLQRLLLGFLVLTGAELLGTYRLAPHLMLEVEGFTFVGLLGLYSLQHWGSIRLRSWGLIGLVSLAITAWALDTDGLGGRPWARRSC